MRPVNLIHKLKTYLTTKEKAYSTRVHIDEPLAVFHLTNYLKHFLHNTSKTKEPIILCIGTDRATGDSLGPLTGWQLQTLLRGSTAQILGTVDSPVHAGNLKEVFSALTPKLSAHPLIAVDACLGQYSNVGTILLQPGPLKPGTATKKTLPEVGDIGFSGIVNVGGLMELQIIQSTRLSIVLKMSQIIANSIFLALRNNHYLLSCLLLFMLSFSGG